jgi:hypothetical protein
MALDPSNRALQERIYALQDAQAAEQASAQAAQAAAQQREGLEQTLLQLQGDTAGLRARELAALDPYNRALQQQIYTLQDAQRATQELSAAWGGASDSIASEIARIRGLSAADGAQSYAALAAQFATTTAQARAGDATAAKSLAGISQAMISAYAGSATSALDVTRVQGSTAASLEGTQKVLHALGIPGFASGGNHLGGLRLVGERGPELEITGPARIYNASQTAQMLAGGDSSEVLRKLQALCDEVRALWDQRRAQREDEQMEAISLIRNTNRTATALDRLMETPNALNVRVMTD